MVPAPPAPRAARLSRAPAATLAACWCRRMALPWARPRPTARCAPSSGPSTSAPTTCWRPPQTDRQWRACCGCQCQSGSRRRSWTCGPGWSAGGTFSAAARHRTWDLGPGTWEAGPGTCVGDYWVADMCAMHSSRCGRETLNFQAQVPGGFVGLATLPLAVAGRRRKTVTGCSDWPVARATSTAPSDAPRMRSTASLTANFPPSLAGTKKRGIGRLSWCTCYAKEWVKQTILNFEPEDDMLFTQRVARPCPRG